MKHSEITLMDKEYVEREALLERLSYNGLMNLPPMEYYREVVTKFPAADVEPVRHGKWNFDYYKGVYYCSLCNNINTPGKYCGCCGALMDGGNKNE